MKIVTIRALKYSSLSNSSLCWQTHFLVSLRLIFAHENPSTYATAVIKRLLKHWLTYRVHKSIIDWIYGVVFANVTFSLEEDWSSVEAIISPEYGKSPFTISLHQGPIDSRGSTMPRKKRRVVTDAFVFGVIDDPSRWNGNNQWQTLLFDLSGWEQGCILSGKQHLAYICENRRILHRSNTKK